MYGDPAGCIAPCMKVELPSEKSWNFITSCFEVLMTSDPAYTWLSWFQKLNIELWRLILFKVSFEFTPFCIAIFAYAFLQSVWAYLTTQPSVTAPEITVHSCPHKVSDHILKCSDILKYGQALLQCMQIQFCFICKWLMKQSLLALPWGS